MFAIVFAASAPLLIFLCVYPPQKIFGGLLIVLNFKVVPARHSFNVYHPNFFLRSMCITKKGCVLYVYIQNFCVSHLYHQIFCLSPVYQNLPGQ